MATKSKFQAIKGTRDLLPPETALWNRVEQTAHQVFATFGFGEIRLPIFEETELFARSVGADTDIVSKEMYSFEDRSALSLPIIEKAEDFQTYAEEVASAMRNDQLRNTKRNQHLVQEFTKKTQEVLELIKEIPEERQRQPAPSYLVERAIDVFRMSTQFELGVGLSLRPEATASVCRAYVEHNMQQLPQPVKLYYLGPMFRRERPQKGRYRQFYQIGAEVLGGSDAPAIDAEVIQMVMTFFQKLKLQGVELDINSIGCKNCRPKYVELLRAELEKVKDKLGPDSQRRIDTNPLRVLDSKLEFEQGVIEKLPRIADHLCGDCATHYAAVKRELELRGVIYRENWRLVRGLDYYMRTTFEITAQGLGSQNAVCGGGRYDGLAELLGGPPTKGIGFAIGEDRLILSLQESARANAPRVVEISAAVTGRASVTATAHIVRALDVYIAWMGEKAYATAVRAAKDLRNAGFSVELPPAAQKFGKALGQADKLGAKYALILGEDEVAEGSWTLKTLADGTQTKLPEPALIEHLRKHL